MARAKSVVMTPAEKKAVAADLKLQIKAAKDNLKQIKGVRKEVDATLSAATKAHLAAIKTSDKELTAAQKSLDSLEAQLTALTAPVEA